jgi:hypothetical protein
MLAGDRTALEKVYRLEAHGNRDRWTLVMLPSDAKLAELVLRIDVEASRDRVRSIEIRQADGDRSVMTITMTNERPGTSRRDGTARRPSRCGSPDDRVSSPSIANTRFTADMSAFLPKAPTPSSGCSSTSCATARCRGWS